jgi:hypothetical protein
MSVLSGWFRKRPARQTAPDFYVVTMSQADSTGGCLVRVHQKSWDKRKCRQEVLPLGHFYSLNPAKEGDVLTRIPAHFEKLPAPCTREEVEAARQRILARLAKGKH